MTHLEKMLQPDSQYVFYDDQHGFCINTDDVLMLFEQERKKGEWEEKAMTKELAIKILSTRDKYGVPCGYTSGYEEALDMAIEALKERPRGKWREITPEEDEYMSFLGWLECTNCISKVVIFSNFCPNCGADMRGDKDDKR